MTNDSSFSSRHHYFCYPGSTYCEKVAYLVQATSGYIFYIELENGVKIDRAVELMLSDTNVNRYSSPIKGVIEAWYEKYLLPYDDYIEDVIYCNNRTLTSLGPFDPNGGNIIWPTAELYFQENGTNVLNADLSCSNVTDRFSVSNTSAPLKHKVGLMTKSEAKLIGMSFPADDREYHMSPTSYSDGKSNIAVIATGYDEQEADYRSGIRPVISLAPGTIYSSGDGSINSPYIVELY